jgi:2'-hydroxyisoflavone reductase
MRRLLVLGGTAWLGREIAQKALLNGAEVFCLARGDSGAKPEGVHFVQADRTLPGAYDRLDGEWDEVIELANELELVESALDAIADRARHWTMVSTVSVYRRNDEPGADETAELVEPAERAETDGPTDYAQAKVAAERASTARVGDRLLIARPGLIVGPGDPSDRFGYWPARLRRGGRVLAPTIADRFVQVIDVGDLAAWIIAAGISGVTGIMNAVGESHAFDNFLLQVSEVAGFTGELVTVDDAWLLEHDVHYWAGPRSLPLWLPVPYTGFAKRSNAAYLAAGGIIRPLRDGISRVLEYEAVRNAARPRLSGLSPEEETDLLDRAR